MKYFVEIDGQEWTVEIGSGGAEVGGEPVAITSGTLPGEVEVAWRGKRLRWVALPPQPGGRVAILLGGRVLAGRVESERERLMAGSRPAQRTAGPYPLRSEIPGVIRQVFKRPGDAVEAGEPVLTLEAMKMENEVRSEVPGVVRELRVEPGRVVESGEVLAVISPP